ncbi:hypothetical protein [Ochrobactrum quorumnocens]|jgi:hypothetical protein|uniref:hypothetical protein n=1 Tax=Ochrobactrum quorumnocens TaxID=271865 RepID=UPI00178071EA|nr:hypothetical protein [Ochrobactrum gallinarum]
MKKIVLILSLALLPLFSGVLLLTGVETTHREHRTDYSFFIKQQPSRQVFFENPIVCGECDVEIYEKLPLSRLEEIQSFCRHRFGLDNLRMCHAIFAEEQRQAHTPTQDLDAIEQVAARFLNNSNIENGTNFLFPSINDKTVVKECARPLSAKWREDADQKKRVVVNCEETNQPAPENRWSVTLSVVNDR